MSLRHQSQMSSSHDSVHVLFSTCHPLTQIPYFLISHSSHIWQMCPNTFSTPCHSHPSFHFIFCGNGNIGCISYVTWWLEELHVWWWLSVRQSSECPAAAMLSLALSQKPWPFVRYVIISAKWMKWMAEIMRSFNVCLFVCVFVWAAAGHGS